MDTFLAEFDFQNSNFFSLGAVPTRAVIESERFGIGLQQRHRPEAPFHWAPNSLLPTRLHWDPKVHASPGLNGGKVFSACPGRAMGGDAPPYSIMGVDPNLRDPYVVNWKLGVQHVLSDDLSLEVSYVGNHGGRLLRFRDINQPNIVTSNTP